MLLAFAEEAPSWWAQGGTNFVVLCSAMMAVFGVGYRALKPLAERWIETNKEMRKLEIEMRQREVDQHKAFGEQVAAAMAIHAREHSEILAALQRMQYERQHGQAN